tara:strand:+ start:131 stop:295 length:165 start_codon:yes stop_codon:yes gene_type:complete
MDKETDTTNYFLNKKYTWLQYIEDESFRFETLEIEIKKPKDRQNSDNRLLDPLK